MNLGSEEQIRLAEAEIEILNELRHPHIVRLHSSAVVQNTPADGAYRGFMLFSYYQVTRTHSLHHTSSASLEDGMQEGSAAELVGRLYESGCRLSPFSVLDIFRQICEAVQFLHAAGYCHRDIKPHNILIEHRNRNGCDQDPDDPQGLMLSCIPEVSDEDMDSVEWVGA